MPPTPAVELDEHKNPKSVASNVMFTFMGVSTLPVNLLPGKKSDPKELRVVCPTCEAAHPLKQQYACEVDAKHGPFAVADAHRAIEVDKVLHKVTTDQIDVLKQTDVPTGVADVKFFNAADVEAHTIAAGNIYRVQPKANPDLYALYVELVQSSPELAFICELTMRNVQKMYRIVARDGILTLLELIRPGMFNDVRIEVGECDHDMLERLRGFALASVETFDPEAWKNKTIKSIAQLKKDVVDPNAPKPEPVETKRANEPMAALEAMLAKAEAPAPARKRTTKKAAAKRKAA